ncbi:DUF975 family protein [Floricoccus penangensis]|uniref:Beta-carotene 15,15'-monooxygenase n=1 Tax=Floricoccus penangensis TaxID=1859475 RepID=A0A9Q5JH32_9LACT|nr:DUF975 family protein [Floricoccus penangensis]OFI47246.1 hypothetical protein BG262_01070 [Floricoccus penangensis]URZ87296.1 DUF975 family protein [Floricoccus penangensis]
MNRKLIKKEAKDFVRQNLKYSISLWSLTIVLSYISGTIGYKIDAYIDGDAPLTLNILSLLVAIAVFITRSSANYVTLDNLRFGRPTGKAFQQQSEILSSQYFWPNVGISLIVGAYMIFWGILFALCVLVLSFISSPNIPNWLSVSLIVIFAIGGVILYTSKVISYIQATNVYKDAIDNGIKLSWRQAIKRSQVLMYGRKLDYVIFNLSFVLWGLLVLVTLGLASFYVLPYMQTANQNYYIKLREEKLTAGL